ncbi:MAG TPA: LysR family transcriptional regulator, partial [Macromonas sp.]|nr:LysR family transcriptional regulator [Macromonas sp.]
MLKLSLEAIEIVEAIARHGSFAAAAERLHKVPSTISYAVAKLEEQLGLALFVRNGPRVALTAAGQE